MSVRDSRTIEKSLLSPGSRKLFKLKCDQARLLFIGLVLVADDFGRLEGDPEDLTATFSRMNMSIETSSDHIKDLIRVGLINQYKVDGGKYIEINDFEAHQDWHGISNRGSKIPSNPDSIATTTTGAQMVVAEHHQKSATTTEEGLPNFTNTVNRGSLKESGQSATACFKQAKRIYRRFVGTSFGSLGNRGYQWEEFVRKHGSELVISAMEIYARELGKGGRNLGYPLAHFLKNSEEFIEAAQIQAMPEVVEIPKVDDSIPDPFAIPEDPNAQTPEFIEANRGNI